MKYFVYEFRSDKNFVYYGATINPKSRQKNHVNAKSRSNSLLFPYFEEFGKDCFVFKVLFEFDNAEDMKNKEIELIASEDKLLLINKRKGGEWYGKERLNRPTMKKLIDFKNMQQAIQDYADKNCDENFSMAVRVLIREALANDNDIHTTKRAK